MVVVVVVVVVVGVLVVVVVSKSQISMFVLKIFGPPQNDRLEEGPWY